MQAELADLHALRSGLGQVSGAAQRWGASVAQNRRVRSSACGISMHAHWTRVLCSTVSRLTQRLSLESPQHVRRSCIRWQPLCISSTAGLRRERFRRMLFRDMCPHLVGVCVCGGGSRRQCLGYLFGLEGANRCRTSVGIRSRSPFRNPDVVDAVCTSMLHHV